MITMLFNSFDTYYYFIPEFIATSFLIVILTNFYKVGSRSFTILIALKKLADFFEDLNPKFLPKSSMFILTSLAMHMFYLNVSSNYPYIFAITSTLTVGMPMIFTIWLGTLSYMVVSYWKGFISHLIPQGCPMYLVPFLFLIELVSTFIRPVTGSMRLIANVMAGHLLMILLSKVVLFIFPAVAAYMILNVAELIIAGIQAYIFVTMISLYLCDLR